MGETVILGGGIAGLACAHELLDRGLAGSLLLLEAEGRAGGNIRTLHEDGFVCEWGPNGFLDNVPATLDLARRVGLTYHLLPADVDQRHASDDCVRPSREPRQHGARLSDVARLAEDLVIEHDDGIRPEDDAVGPTAGDRLSLPLGHRHRPLQRAELRRVRLVDIRRLHLERDLHQAEEIVAARRTRRQDERRGSIVEE